MKARAFVVVVLFSTALVLAILAFRLPVKSSPQCTLPSGGLASCSVFEITPLWYYQSLVEVAEGLAVVGLIILFSLRGDVSGTNQESLKKKVNLAVSVGALVAFMSISTIDILQEGRSVLTIQRFAEALSMNDVETYALGYFGFGCLLVAVVGLTLNSKRGRFWQSFVQSIILLAAPVVVFLELGLLIVSPLAMVTYMTLFLKPFVISGIPLISNWFALAVASVLTGWGYPPRLIVESAGPSSHHESRATRRLLSESRNPNQFPKRDAGTLQNFEFSADVELRFHGTRTKKEYGQKRMNLRS